MRLLFEMDLHDYDDCTHTYVRDSARSVIIRDGRIAMVHSAAYDYYKFPGGGIKAGEDPVAAMIRETREESGLIVIPETVREFGYVHRIQKSTTDPTEIFIQDNFYYLCGALDAPASQQLDDYEARERYALEFVDPRTAVMKNRSVGPTPYHPWMFEREARVLELLMEEGYLNC